jgi:processive 1,2-diacylglycerol beta-glucosyltransferase
LIINTHFLPAELVAEQRRRGRLHCPQMTVTTDYETHRLWVQPPTERYFAATELGRAGLESWDVPADAIEVTGIPVRSAFTRPPERAAARARHGLAPDRPVVLLSCGAFGVSGSEEVFRELMRLPGDVQHVVICGRNERLLARLAELLSPERSGVRLLGFSDEMESWMAAADVLVTNPGGLTTSEALACGLPMVLVNPIPGQEQRNADYLLEHGAAIKVNNCRLLAHRVESLLRDAGRLRALRAAATRLARPDAAQRIADSAIRLLAAAQDREDFARCADWRGR